ncbi:MAG: recombination mediator RecR [Oscillospiraceae bacterium]
MSYNVAALSKLIEQFERMPSVGRKSAQRMAFYVLSMSKDDAKAFANAIVDAHEKIHKCKICCNLTQDDICSVCNNDARDKSIVCVVEDPRDVMAIERTHEFNGTYHVLHGVISPLNGIGPNQLSLKQLLARMNSDEVKEVIMATNPTVEGEATAMYISKLLKPIGIKTTRLAYGVPVGADLEYADEVTLSRAMEGRRVM